jgi:very-short-patch-repair endonuclease
LDGDQRFRQVRNWKTPEETRKLDIYKQNKAIEKGYSVIRILQKDVFYDKNDWLNTLLEKIKELSNSTEKKVIYICSNNEYQIFIDEENKLVV